MNSMTGFGAAEGPVGRGQMRIEVRSVNHRHLNLHLKLPSDLTGAEAVLKERIRKALARGHVSLSARWTEEPERTMGLAVDIEKARAVVAGVETLKKELGLPGVVDVTFVARQPGVLRSQDGPDETGEREGVDDLCGLVDDALNALVSMRAAEGAQLHAALLGSVEQMEKAVGLVEERAPKRLEEEKQRIEKNITELMGAHQVDEARVAQEIAHLADRLDITEELTRLRSHFGAAREAMSGEDAVGRRLSFLSQEILREVNTIGSKANDAEIAAHVIEMKTEIEKFKEQVENVE